MELKLNSAGINPAQTTNYSNTNEIKLKAGREIECTKVLQHAYSNGNLALRTFSVKKAEELAIVKEELSFGTGKFCIGKLVNSWKNNVAPILPSNLIPPKHAIDAGATPRIYKPDKGVYVGLLTDLSASNNGNRITKPVTFSTGDSRSFFVNKESLDMINSQRWRDHLEKNYIGTSIPTSYTDFQGVAHDSTLLEYMIDEREVTDEEIEGLDAIIAKNKEQATIYSTYQEQFKQDIKQQKSYNEMGIAYGEDGEYGVCIPATECEDENLTLNALHYGKLLANAQKKDIPIYKIHEYGAQNLIVPMCICNPDNNS